MIIIMKTTIESDIKQISDIIEQRGYTVHVSRGVEKTIIGAIGTPDEEKAGLAHQLEALPSVERVVPILKPYKIVARECRPEGSVVQVRNVKIGGPELAVMAGPCAVETEELLLEAARGVKKAGANILRGGAFKPSTSPYSFHGLGKEGLKYLREVADELDMVVITEVMDARDIELVSQYVDILQVGTRNMTNFSLLTEIGNSKFPVMLKRGMASTLEEWLQAAEYMAARGNYNIILCERGIRTFETYTRNTFDISAIPAVKELSHLPIIADPSHGTGRRHLIKPVAKAAIAAGADGLMIEVHPYPEKALKDSAQALTIESFTQLMQEVAPVAAAVNRRMPKVSR